MKPETRERLKDVSTATISMQLMKRGIRNASMGGIKPLAAGQPRLVGEAYTLRYTPGREDLSTVEYVAALDNPQRTAIEECPAGAVLVVDARGVDDCGTLGDILAARLQARGVVGAVLDGAVRDAAAVRAVGLPMWCKGAAPPPSIHSHFPADKQVPIACGGVTVLPGDVIVADEDGVSVIPARLADEVAEAGTEQERVERFVQLMVRKGHGVLGLYPPNAEWKARYEAWVAAGEPNE